MACGGLSEPEPRDRELFVATYVDLREAALASPDGKLTEAARAAVLERNGVSEVELLAFVETWSQDLDVMRVVWEEIEERLDVEREQPPRR